MRCVDSEPQAGKGPWSFCAAPFKGGIVDVEAFIDIADPPRDAAVEHNNKITWEIFDAIMGAK
ncbi:MAG: hypothetical protein Q4G25_07685 [Paracoccus sp. (in: a-proteobacteria)]|nr:hypothetical protein [Paracoccus sp. (in: a-proteobacteria)]